MSEKAGVTGLGRARRGAWAARSGRAAKGVPGVRPGCDAGPRRGRRLAGPARPAGEGGHRARGRDAATRGVRGSGGVTGRARRRSGRWSPRCRGGGSCAPRLGGGRLGGGARTCWDSQPSSSRWGWTGPCACWGARHLRPLWAPPSPLSHPPAVLPGRRGPGAGPVRPPLSTLPPSFNSERGRRGGGRLVSPETRGVGTPAARFRITRSGWLQGQESRLWKRPEISQPPSPSYMRGEQAE